MAILGKKYFDTTSLNEGFMDNVVPADYSGCETVMEATFKAIEETERNWNNITRAIAIQELAYLEENGIEMIYEAEDNKKWYNTIIEFLKSIPSKIMGIGESFAKLVDKMVGFIDGKFTTSVLAAGYKNLPSGYVFKGYEFKKSPMSVLEGGGILSETATYDIVEYIKNNLDKSSGEGYTSAIENLKKEVEKCKGEINKRFTGSNHIAIDSGNTFSTALRKIYVSGGDPVELDILSHYDTILKKIHEAKDIRRSISKINSAISKSYSKNIRVFEQANKKLEKDYKSAADDDGKRSGTIKMGFITEGISSLKAVAGWEMNAYGVLLSVVGDEIKQYVRACKVLAGYAAKKNAGEKSAKTESAMGEIIPGVTLI